MSAYLKFFQLEKSPFDTQAQSNLVLGTKALRGAFGEIETGLADGAARICVDGKSGLGKTSLARALPKLLSNEARVVLILNPSLPWSTLRSAIVKQLDLAEGNLSRKTLMRARGEGRKLVIVVDQAERISSESLDHLDILLGYKNDDDEQLLHCVLLANLEAAASLHTDRGEQCPLLWWLDRLNTLQLEFHPIPANGVASYVQKHLNRAGWKGGQLFTPEAMQTIHRLTGGVPREMSDLCARSLELAGEQEAQRIDVDMVEACFGEIPLEEMLDAEMDSTDCDPGFSTDDRSEYERTRPSPAPEGRARAATHASDLHDDDPRIDRMPGAARRASRQIDAAPLSLDSFFGDSGFDPSTAASPASVAVPAATAALADAESSAEEMSETMSAFDEASGGETSTGRGRLRKLAIAAAVLLTIGAGALGTRHSVGGTASDPAAAEMKPAVLGRPKPAPVAEPAPLAGIEPAFNAEPPTSRMVESFSDADFGLGLAERDAEASAIPDAANGVATAAPRQIRILDRTSDDDADLLDDLEQALVDPPFAASTAPDAASASAAPAAPAAGWQNPAEAEIDAPFW